MDTSEDLLTCSARQPPKQQRPRHSQQRMRQRKMLARQQIQLKPEARDAADKAESEARQAGDSDTCVQSANTHMDSAAAW